MKSLRKVLFSLVVFLMVFLGVCAVASADDGETIYFTPNSNWTTDNARFAIYTWDADGVYQWIDMTDSDGNGVYEAVLPAGYTNLIFCRLDPGEEHNGWSTTWNQTDDLKYDGKNNHYTLASGAWNKGEGSWSVYDGSACAHTYDDNGICTKCAEELYLIIAGNVMKKDGEYRQGDNSTLFVSEWDVSDENNRMFYDEESGCYLKIYENVAKGEYHFKVAENKSWDISYGKDGENCYLNVEQDGSTVVITFKDGNITCAAGVVNTPDAPQISDEPIDEEPEEKLNFLQKIWQAILNFFKNLFGGKNK